MICKNCGAEYEDALIECPFCHAENKEEAYRRQRSYVDGYKEKASFLSKLPDLIVGKTGNAMKGIAVIAIVVFLVILLIAFLGTKIYSATAVWRMDRAVEKMEKYYEAGEYEKLEDYYWDVDHVGGAIYEKYYRTVSVYSDIDWISYRLQQYGDDYVEYISVEEVEDTLYDLMACLYEIEVMEQEGFVYDERKAMLEFRAQLMDMVEAYIPMNDEEFQVAYERYVADENVDYTEEAELILNRLLEE